MKRWFYITVQMEDLHGQLFTMAGTRPQMVTMHGTIGIGMILLYLKLQNLLLPFFAGTSLIIQMQIVTTGV